MKAGAAASGMKAREKVLDAALAVLLEQGYEAASMQSVADLAQVSRRSLFNHFQTKEAMFAAAIEEVWAKVPVSKILADATTLEHPDTALRLIGKEIANFWRPDTSVALVRLIIREGGRFPFLSRDYLEKGKLPILQKLASYMAQTSAKGLLKVTDPVLAAQQFAGLINEPLGWYRVLGQEETISLEFQEKVVEEAVSIFLARYSP